MVRTLCSSSEGSGSFAERLPIARAADEHDNRHGQSETRQWIVRHDLFVPATAAAPSGRPLLPSALRLRGRRRRLRGPAPEPGTPGCALGRHHPAAGQQQPDGLVGPASPPAPPSAARPLPQPAEAAGARAGVPQPERAAAAGPVTQRLPHPLQRRVPGHAAAAHLAHEPRPDQVHRGARVRRTPPPRHTPPLAQPPQRHLPRVV
ncbi:hypothetical protein CDAR_616101 [Caerostris darwini]|uniref:Uncharacterized protein n=1 Tax=Caerostris darwini TaxID=1538125 RepID=A0AAV4RYA0_9ARAC|nr:hypothetical protein CDAR_616101 [Caerostris darwini]